MASACGEQWTARRILETVRGGPHWMDVLGATLIFCGILALVAVVVSSFLSVYLLGALLLAAAAATFSNAVAFWRQRWAGFFLGFGVGILYALAGILSYVRPESALAGLTLALGLGFLFMGVLRGWFNGVTRFPGWNLGVLTGCVDLVLGILILFWWPADSLVVLGALVGVELIMAGTGALVTGAAVRKLLAPLAEQGPRRPITRFQH